MGTVTKNSKFKIQNSKLKSGRFKISVIIPAYNEKNTIEEIIKRVQAVKIPKEIIIVDDFSTDGTREALKKIKDKNINKFVSNEIKIIFQDKNYGKGYAIRTAIKYITGDIIVIQDADLEYDPKDYFNLVSPIIKGKTKVVYGTRFPNGAKKPPLTNSYFMGNRLLTLISNLLYNAKITDEPTGYKIFDAKTLKDVNLECIRFEFCPEITAKVRKKKLKIYEVPIRYYPRSIEEGKKIRWKDGLEALWVLLKYRFFD